MLDLLPQDWRRATLLGRIETPAGPTPVLVRNGHVLDISRLVPTTADFSHDLATNPRLDQAPDLGDLEFFGFRRAWEVPGESPTPSPRLLPPVDLHCIKAAGVTFANSTL